MHETATRAPAATHRVLVLGGGAAAVRLLDLARCSALRGSALELFTLDAETGRTEQGFDALLHTRAETDPPSVTAVLRALHETNAHALVVGYPQDARGRVGFTDIVERATAAAPLDIVVCVDRHGRPWRRVLVPYLYGPLDSGALDVARCIARDGESEVTVLHVEEPYARYDGAYSPGSHIGECTLKVVTADDPIAAAAREARRGYDLIVLGGAERRTRGRYFTMRQQRLLLATDATLVIVHTGRQNG